MTLLLDNRLAPITSTIIFFEAEVGNTVTAFLEWQIPIQNKRGVSFDQSHLQGNLEGMFKSLLPLTSVERSRYGAVIFSLYGPESNGPTNLVRSVYAANDGGEWVFNATGTKQSFEQEDKYSSPQIRDRFTLEMLEHYLRVLGVQAFEEQFYLCEKF